MIPTQSQADMDDPEEHVVWALVHLPNVGGVVQVTHPMILRAWSKHLVECGFVWAPGLAELADENGMIHVSQLPAQQIKHQPPHEGRGISTTTQRTGFRWIHRSRKRL